MTRLVSWVVVVAVLLLARAPRRRTGARARLRQAAGRDCPAAGRVPENQHPEGQILDTAELGAGRANFYARLKGSGTGKAIALVHHMDVVPVSRQFWSQDPFGGVVKDGYVWGRGALDMKGHGIVQLMTLIAFKRAGIVLPRDVVFLGNADEESGGLGSRTFIKRHPELISDVEYLLTESGGSRVENGKVRWFGINVGEKRVYWQKLVVRGKASHGSRPTKDNPVPRLARLLTRAAAWETPLVVSPAIDRYFKAQAKSEHGEHRRNRPALLCRGRHHLLRYRSSPLRYRGGPAGSAWK